MLYPGNESGDGSGNCNEDHGRPYKVTERDRQYILKHPGMFDGVQGKIVGEDELRRRKERLKKKLG